MLEDKWWIVNLAKQTYTHHMPLIGDEPFQLERTQGYLFRIKGKEYHGYFDKIYLNDLCKLGILIETSKKKNNLNLK